MQRQRATSATDAVCSKKSNCKYAFSQRRESVFRFMIIIGLVVMTLSTSQPVSASDNLDTVEVLWDRFILRSRNTFVRDAAKVDELNKHLLDKDVQFVTRLSSGMLIAYAIGPKGEKTMISDGLESISAGTEKMNVETAVSNSLGVRLYVDSPTIIDSHRWSDGMKRLGFVFD